MMDTMTMGERMHRKGALMGEAWSRWRCEGIHHATALWKIFKANALDGASICAGSKSDSNCRNEAFPFKEN